ncbi:ribonuclease H2 subunit A [Cylindrobasidium torrendii FP15055 ss-10]|uniref:Ribonuclease n=1 Tax=Cylindrobasidium torrendii FP15055 ss-10 TaxID=1314674 RepID=A0A0D7BMW8_9AGAR|nr:ribonuclease H2 subunit A [Cylindrobasidium torrendii FP15055 ss-10]
MSDDDEEIRIPSAPGPSVPITTSYTYHSPTPTAEGPYILGVDEAGRGPVLGPMVYGVAFCPKAWGKVDEMGFNDSKQLTPEMRSTLFNTLSEHEDHFGWAVRVISPQDISSGMLKRPAINLNEQAKAATVLLIREVMEKGIQISELYVDALGPIPEYQRYLSSLFPGVSVTVEKKADATYKIVGAASIAAKKTRDVCVEQWCWEEEGYTAPDIPVGSGYPSDPNTKNWLQEALHPVFGFPRLVRFSWQTITTIMDRHGHAVEWSDEGQNDLRAAFKMAEGLDKGRCLVAKDLHVKNITCI